MYFITIHISQAWLRQETRVRSRHLMLLAPRLCVLDIALLKIADRIAGETGLVETKERTALWVALARPGSYAVDRGAA